MAKASKWLKLDKKARVSVRIGTKKNLEVRVTVPAKSIKAQLKKLQP